MKQYKDFHTLREAVIHIANDSLTIHFIASAIDAQLAAYPADQELAERVEKELAILSSDALKHVCVNGACDGVLDIISTEADTFLDHIWSGLVAPHEDELPRHNCLSQF